MAQKKIAGHGGEGNRTLTSKQAEGCLCHMLAFVANLLQTYR